MQTTERAAGASNTQHLYDVSDIAQALGFPMPVSISAALWRRYVYVAGSNASLRELERLLEILNAYKKTLNRLGKWPEVAVFRVHVGHDNWIGGPFLASLKGLRSRDGENLVTVKLLTEN